MRPVRIDDAGLTGPTRATAAGPAWRTSSYGLLVPAGVEVTAEQRVMEAAARMPEAGMVTGWAALRLAGAAYFDGQGADGRSIQQVALLLPHASRIRGEGVIVVRTRRPLPDPVTRHGIACAPTEVALLHELERCPTPRRAGVMVDMALAAGVLELADLLELVEGRRVSPQVSYALARACPHCCSPKESEMLQVWEGDLGLPRPLMNHEVLDLTGRLIAVVDLLEVESGTYGEYNGAAHRDRERQRRDEARAADLRDVGLEGFVLVGGDRERVWRQRMSTARGRALWLPEERRAWKVGAFVPAPPLAGEVDPDEVALDAIMREHHRSYD